MKNTIRKSKLFITAFIVMLSVVVFFGCAGTSEKKEHKIVYEITPTDEQDQFINLSEMSDATEYADWFIKFGEGYADYLYRNGDYPESASEMLADYAMCSFSDDGRAIIIANVFDSYGAGHHTFLILRSDDYGESWKCSDKAYYVDSSVIQIVIDGDNVYFVFGFGARSCGYIWYSNDFAQTFTAYTGIDLMGGYSDVLEEILPCDLRILNTEDDGIIVGFLSESQLFDQWNIYEDAEYHFICKISKDVKNAEMIYMDDNILELG